MLNRDIFQTRPPKKYTHCIFVLVYLVLVVVYCVVFFVWNLYTFVAVGYLLPIFSTWYCICWAYRFSHAKNNIFQLFNAWVVMLISLVLFVLYLNSPHLKELDDIRMGGRIMAGMACANILMIVSYGEIFYIRSKR